MSRSRHPFAFDRIFGSLDRRLERPVRNHLKSVYGCLTLSTLTAALGGWLHATSEHVACGLFTLSLALASLLLLATIQDNGKNWLLRLGLLVSFAFFSGVNLGPLLDMAIRVNPTLVSKAFLSTGLIFTCFTFSALFATSQQTLYSCGVLLSILSLLFSISLASFLMDPFLVFHVNLYVGFAMMCVFVIYDTRLIIEKRRAGDKDFIWHSVDLFFDVLGLFRRLLVILTQKEEKK